MAKTQTYTIHLLNKSYDIKCPEKEAEHLKQAATKLNEQMRANKKQFHHLDDFQALLLAALNISSELLRCEGKQEERNQQLTQLINSLEHKIHEAGTAL